MNTPRKIAIPPPRGVGCTCTLRCPGRSISPSTGASFLTSGVIAHDSTVAARNPAVNNSSIRRHPGAVQEWVRVVR